MCQYCDIDGSDFVYLIEQNELANRQAHIYIHDSNLISETYHNGVSWYDETVINFCPICGRWLKENNNE